jgi:hypothetical protein
MKRFEAFSQTGRFDWREAMMRVVQQMKLFAKLLAQPLE